MGNFKSDTLPLCRSCGGAIPKYILGVTLVDKVGEYQKNSRWNRYVVGVSVNKAGCNKFTNMQVVSVKYNQPYDEGTRKRIKGTVHSFTEWDGETYIDGYFCKDACAMNYGRMVVDKCSLVSQAYISAREKRAAKAVATK